MPADVATYRSHAAGVLATVAPYGFTSVSDVVPSAAMNNMVDSHRAHGSTGKTFVRGTNNNVGGALLLGYGILLNNRVLYFSIEGVLDIAGNKVKKETDWTYSGPELPPDGDDDHLTLKEVSFKQKGFVPTVVARLGAFFPSYGVLVYLRGGAAFVRSELDTRLGKISANKLVPVLGGGIEKKVGKLSYRLEFDYRFGGEKTGTLVDKFAAPQDDGALGGPVEHSMRIRLKTSGYAVRALVVYNFH
jgi:hypothetical protein